MSSVFCYGSTCFEGTNAVDGNYEQLSFAQTYNEENPWIQIDLGYATCISAVEIWNRNHPNNPGILIVKLFDKII